MKKFLIGIFIGMMLGTIIGGGVIAYSSDIGIEKLWNQVFDSTNNVIRVEGV